MPNIIKQNLAIIIMCIVAFFILSAKLDKPYMWQDEAEVALLARSINENGIPNAWNGINLITQLNGNDSNENFIWSFHPWIPFYLVSASFKLLGESNFSARIPFVLLGVLSLLALWFFTIKTTGCRNTAFLACIFLLLNMQFILHTRQCKYYSILFFIAPIFYYSYLKINDSWRFFTLFLISVMILFHTNFVSLYTSLIGLILYTFIVERNFKTIYRFVFAGIIAIAFTLPFFLIGDLKATSSQATRLPSLFEYFDKFARHLWYFNDLVFPLLLFIPLIIIWRKGWINNSEKKTVKFLLWIIIPAWMALPLLNQDVFRYNLQLIPLLILIIAIMSIAIYRRHKWLGIIFVVTMLCTNLIANFPKIAIKVGFNITNIRFEKKTEWFVNTFNKEPYKTRKFFKKTDKELDEYNIKYMVTHDILKPEYLAYFYELTREYPDAIEQTVEFIKEKGAPGDILYTNFDQLSYAYYLPKFKISYRVDNKELSNDKSIPLPGYVSSFENVRWYIERDIKLPNGPYVPHEIFLTEMRDKGKKIKEHKLNISSLYWDTNWPQRFRPYINKMLWQDKEGYQKVSIFEVK